jgi:RNA polymerase sigma factor (sigma-70 family)
MALQITSPYDQDAYLVEDFQRGNNEAFTELMKIHLPWVYGLCRRVSREEAEDLCQEIFLQVYQSMSKLRHPRAFAAWLRKVTWHYCQKKSVKIRHSEVLDEAIISSNPWDAVIDGGELGWAFDQLSKNHRQVVILSLVYGFKSNDISAMLGIPCGTVKSRLHNARKSLQSLLIEVEGDLSVETKERLIHEIESRIEAFNERVLRPIERDPSVLDKSVNEWHQRRQQDAENNARTYGIELVDVGPRMTRERWMSGTMSFEGITFDHMGIPKEVVLYDTRDISRRLLVSPFTILKWVKGGMPTVKYHPWRWFDLNLVKKWIIDNEIPLNKEINETDVDDMTYFILKEVQHGRVTAEEALELIRSN